MREPAASVMTHHDSSQIIHPLPEEHRETTQSPVPSPGQLQVVFGTGVVNKVFEEFSALTGIESLFNQNVIMEKHVHAHVKE